MKMGMMCGMTAESIPKEPLVPDISNCSNLKDIEALKKQI